MISIINLNTTVVTVRKCCLIEMIDDDDDDGDGDRDDDDDN